MGSGKKITINAVSAIVQVLFTALLYFFLYKYLLNNLGAKQLGLWSLILSFSSIANLANFGMTSGLVKFIAEYIATNKEKELGKLIFTAFLSLAILFFVVSIIVYIAAHFLLQYVVETQYISLALTILPFSLGGLCINAASGVITSVLEGYQKNYLRNLIYIFSGILMFVSMVLLTPKYQLQGMAYAQLIQAVFILIFALFLIFKINKYNRFKYWKWSGEAFKELFNYGYKFQVVSICQMLYEPTTKMLLSKFGGLALLGHYEMASRLVNQFRAVLVNANQVVIPVIAEKAKTQTKEMMISFYSKMNRVLLLLTLPLSTLLIIFTPLISVLWIGSINAEFTIAVYILTIATMFNIMCGPSYFSCLGEGKLSMLVYVHMGMAILNLGLGYVLGITIGGYGIILAWGMALSVGSITIIVAYSRNLSVTFLKLFSKNEIYLFFLSFNVIVFGILLFTLNTQFNIYINTGICFVLFMFFIPLILRNEIVRLIATKMISKKYKS